MKIINLEDLIEAGAIFVKSIQEGFDIYDYEFLEGNEEYLKEKIQELYKTNGVENSFVDFYYGRLTKTEKEAVDKFLNQKQQDYIESLALKETDIYFQLDNMLLEITLHLSAKEALFSTFYFTKHKCTIWSNYNLKYPMFYEKNENETAD